MIPGKDSVAARAGIRKGDIIAAVNGIPLQSPSEFQHLLDIAGDTELTLTMVRDEKEFPVKLRSQIIPGLPEDFTRYMIGATLARTPQGVKVESAVFSSPAQKAGLLPNDMLLSAAFPEEKNP